MNIEEEGKNFANVLTDTVEASGVYSQLTDPKDSFMSGCYFGAVQGYKRGVNHMLQEAVKNLPEIYNEIVKSNFDMSVNWEDKFYKLILKNVFGIDS